MKLFPPSWQFRRNKPYKATCSLENWLAGFFKIQAMPDVLVPVDGVCWPLWKGPWILTHRLHLLTKWWETLIRSHRGRLRTAAWYGPWLTAVFTHHTAGRDLLVYQDQSLKYKLKRWMGVRLGLRGERISSVKPLSNQIFTQSLSHIFQGPTVCQDLFRVSTL